MAVSVGSPMSSTPLSSIDTEPSQQSVANCNSLRISELLLSEISSKVFPLSQYAFTNVIRFSVRVPVLSDAIIDALPNVSTAGK